MEKITLKVELERDDISCIFNLSGNKLSEELWGKMKGKDCVIHDEDLGEKSVVLKMLFSSIAIEKLLKNECPNIKTNSPNQQSGKGGFAERIRAMEQEREDMRKGIRPPDLTNDEPIVY